MQKIMMSVAIVMLLSDSVEAMRIRKLGEPAWDLAQEDIQLEQTALARIDQKKTEASLLQIQSDPNCDSTGCKTNHYKDEGKMPYPTDYAVPNFGVDHDIVNSETNIAAAEK